MNQPNTVTVKILEKEYQVACPEEQESELVVSAKYLDKQMRSIRETGKVIGLSVAVGDRVEAGLLDAPDAPEDDEGRRHQHEELLAERPLDDLAEHDRLRSVPVFGRGRRL